MKYSISCYNPKTRAKDILCNIIWSQKRQSWTLLFLKAHPNQYKAYSLSQYRCIKYLLKKIDQERYNKVFTLKRYRARIWTEQEARDYIK